MFKRDKDWSGEKIILTTRPNFILGNKGALLAVILLGVLLYFYNLAEVLIANLSLRIIKFIQWPLTQIVTMAFVIIGLILILYIIFKIISWSTHKYTVTNLRVITEKGFIRKNKSSMPYNTIQDIQIDQGIIGRIIGIGSVIIYSAYDGNNLNLHQVSTPQNIEELVFEQMQYTRINQEPISPIHQQANNNYNQANNNNYYEEPLSPIHQQQNNNYYEEQYQQQNNNNYNQTPEYPINNQPNNTYEEHPQNPEPNTFTYSTNTHTLNNEGSFQNTEEHKYTQEEFDDSINEAIKNLNGDVRFQQQEKPQAQPQPQNQQPHAQSQPQQQVQQNQQPQYNNEPHNLYEDSIKETYSVDKEDGFYVDNNRKYDNETERENVIERHKSKFNKYRKR